MRLWTIARTILLGALGLLIGWSLLVYLDYWWHKPPPALALNQREIGLIADELDVKFLAVPSRITTWCFYDAPSYGLNVRVDFREGGPEEPFEAGWFTVSNQVGSTDAAQAFQRSALPDFVAPAADLWGPLPMLAGDVVYHRSGQEADPGRPTGWALVRRQDSTVTLYLVKEGNKINAFALEVLTEEPVNIDWGVPPQGNIYMRSGP